MKWPTKNGHPEDIYFPLSAEQFTLMVGASVIFEVQDIPPKILAAYKDKANPLEASSNLFQVVRMNRRLEKERQLRGTTEKNSKVEVQAQVNAAIGTPILFYDYAIKTNDSGLAYWVSIAYPKDQPLAADVERKILDFMLGVCIEPKS